MGYFIVLAGALIFYILFSIALEKVLEKIFAFHEDPMPKTGNGKNQKINSKHKISKIKNIRRELNRSEDSLSDYFIESIIQKRRSRDLEEFEKIERSLKSVLSSISVFALGIDEEDEYLNSYLLLLEFYETEIKSLKNITEDRHLLDRLREDGKSLQMFLDKFTTLKNDLEMLRDNEKDMEYKQHISFL